MTQKERLMDDQKMTAEVKTVGDVLGMNLVIPNYQRPYRWDEKNVGQLLDDILAAKRAGKSHYRIGSLILYRESTADAKGKAEIVDGQQRLTTLLILAHLCKVDATLKDKLAFSHNESVINIRRNHEFAETWLNDNVGTSRTEFWQYVAEKCDCVVVTVRHLAEAFQMFDTQNGRGKSLEPYNLLKAFHIRAMDLASDEEKRRCDARWEAATQYDATPSIDNDPNVDVLRQLFSEQLFRTRVWSRGDEAGEFSKKKIDEFKGMTVDKNHPTEFPYQNPQFLQFLTEKFYRNVLAGTVGTANRFAGGDPENINAFTNINQMVVNGRAFFEYVETYVEMYKRLFIELGTSSLAAFKEFYYQYCLQYDLKSDRTAREDAFRCLGGKAWRTGDGYLREAYKSLCLAVFDKFGEAGLMKYYKILYRLVYQMRMKKSAVRYNAVAALPVRWFQTIQRARRLTDLWDLEREARNISIPSSAGGSTENADIDLFIRNGAESETAK